MRFPFGECSLAVRVPILLAFLASSASAQFPTTTDTETFDTYSLGQLDGQGHWDGWDGIQTSFANVVNTFSRSAPKSAQLSAGADSVNDSMAGMYTSGQWTVETWAYVPSGFAGKTYFITLNTYADGGPYEWNGQIGFNGDTGRIECDCGSPSSTDRPLVFDQWVDLRLEFDFDNDVVSVYYNTASEATPIASYIISAGVSGQDAFANVRLQAIDLYPDAVTFPHVTPMYFDDISVTCTSCPSCQVEPGSALCFGDGSGTACPCGNTGQTGTGCANSTGEGAALTAGGSGSIAANDTFLQVSNAISGQPGLFFQGNTAVNGGNGALFGDGLRCCGTNVVRLGVVNATGSTTFSVSGTAIMNTTYDVIIGGQPFSLIVAAGQSGSATAKSLVCAIGPNSNLRPSFREGPNGTGLVTLQGNPVLTIGNQSIPPSTNININGQTFGATFSGGAEHGVPPPPTAGDMRCYQFWYRNPVGSPCGSGFNLSNAYSITWTP